MVLYAQMAAFALLVGLHRTAPPRIRACSARVGLKGSSLNVTTECQFFFLTAVPVVTVMIHDAVMRWGGAVHSSGCGTRRDVAALHTRVLAATALKKLFARFSITRSLQEIPGSMDFFVA